MKTLTIIIIGCVVGLGILGLLIQLVPYGRNHTNPQTLQEPNWDSPQTRKLAKDACFDCHSNETVWPWYSNIAPTSWLIQKDVDEGRSRLNFSTWGRLAGESGEAIEVISEGRMPPPQYLILHPEARLSEQQKALFIQGLTAILSHP